MKQYNSLQEMQFDLKRLDLQRQITREEIKQNGYLMKKTINSSLLSSNLINKISKIALLYAFKKIRKKM